MEVLGKIRKFAQFLKLDYNMDTIQIKDKRFKTFIPEADILKEVARVPMKSIMTWRVKIRCF